MRDGCERCSNCCNNQSLVHAWSSLLKKVGLATSFR
ncbi:hypothetical protein X989_5726 [Burkholderia pseudomallei MSHR4378]|nr:hypothetical protein X989_5726 [Burkholderia pseudomallei MSHR4378]